MDKCKIRVKIGENEFEAVGNQEFVTKALSVVTNGIFRDSTMMHIMESEGVVIDSINDTNGSIVNRISDSANPLLPPTEVPAIASFVKEKGANSHPDRVIVLAAYLYTYRDCSEFTKLDIENCYADALLPKSQNINQDINVNRKKGYIEVTGNLKDGLKTFYITQQGIGYVENLSEQSKSRDSASIPNSRKSNKTIRNSASQQKQKKEDTHLVEIVNLVKDCDEAEAIEKYILDENIEVNRALLPLYIVYEYLDDAHTLTTTQIAKITSDLGVRVTRQNALRALKFKGSKYVMTDGVRKPGQPTYYKLNRRGMQYMKSVIQGNINN